MKEYFLTFMQMKVTAQRRQKGLERTNGKIVPYRNIARQYIYLFCNYSSWARRNGNTICHFLLAIIISCILGHDEGTTEKVQSKRFVLSCHGQTDRRNSFDKGRVVYFPLGLASSARSTITITERDLGRSL